MTKYHRAAMLPRAYRVVASTLRDTRFLIVLYRFSARPCCQESLHTLSPLLLSNLLLLVGFGLKRNQTTKSFGILPKIWRKKDFWVIRGLSFAETSMAPSVLTTLRPSWFWVVIWTLEKARCPRSPVKLLGNGPLFVSLLPFNHSSLAPSPRCVFTSGLLPFHWHWTPNSSIL